MPYNYNTDIQGPTVEGEITAKCMANNWVLLLTKSYGEVQDANLKSYLKTTVNISTLQNTYPKSSCCLEYLQNLFLMSERVFNTLSSVLLTKMSSKCFLDIKLLVTGLKKKVSWPRE